VPPRQVTLVLCDAHGTVLGELPSFEVAVPFWQEVADVVAGAKAHAGVDVTVLRLISVDAASQTEGGRVTYLGEVSGPTPELLPWAGPEGVVADDPLRMSYARPGGPARDLAWADAQLEGRGLERTGPAQQVRTWNLSSIWALRTSGGAAWLKVVPPFFTHEGAMLSRIGLDHPGLVPELLGAAGRRVLMRDVPGGDHYDAGRSVLLRLVRALVGLQVEWSARVPELERLGVLDWRVGAFSAAAEDVVDRTSEHLDGPTVSTLRRLLDGLAGRFRDLAGAGIPDSLVHGDFHPGNACGPPQRPVLLDWGDCGIGHPLLDQAAFTARLRGPDRAEVTSEWSRLWQRARPGCDPDRAARLLTPVAALRHAVVYRMFLDRIEATEHVYHAHDPAHWLRRAAGLVTAVDLR